MAFRRHTTIAERVVQPLVFSITVYTGFGLDSVSFARARYVWLTSLKWYNDIMKAAHDSNTFISSLRIVVHQICCEVTSSHATARLPSECTYLTAIWQVITLQYTHHNSLSDSDYNKHVVSDHTCSRAYDKINKAHACPSSNLMANIIHRTILLL